jgi:hypothetical protein
VIYLEVFVRVCFVYIVHQLYKRTISSRFMDVNQYNVHV